MVARAPKEAADPGAGTGVEPTIGIEPMTPSLPRKCSTTEPRGRKGDPARRESPEAPPPGRPGRVERETGFEPATLSLEG